MSDYETHKGKIKLIFQGDEEGLNQKAEELLKEEDCKLEFGDGYSAKELLLDEYYDKYFVINDKLYEVFDHEEFEHIDQFCNLTKNEDGTFNFFTTFYNGGTGLGEMIKDELEEIEQNDSNKS